MAEWSKAAASKAVIPAKTGIAGSNPALSSTLRQGFGWHGQLREIDLIGYVLAKASEDQGP